MLGRSGHNKATDYWSLGIFVYECLHGTTPFAAKNYLSTYKKIAAYSKKGEMKWHLQISKAVQSLMQGLLHAKPHQRLGATEEGIDALKGHEWFEGLDWQQLYDHKIKVSLSHRLRSLCSTALILSEPISRSVNTRHRSFHKLRTLSICHTSTLRMRHT